MNEIKCPSCGYKNEPNKWSVIRNSGAEYSAFILIEYDPKTDSLRHRGAIDLYSCPICKTVISEHR